MVVWHVNTKFLCQTRKANVQKSISRLNLCSTYKYIWLLFISELLDNFPFLNTFVTQETILIYILTMWILFFQSSIEFSLSSMTKYEYLPSMIQNAKVVVLLGFFNFITYQLTFQKFFIAHFFVSAIKDNAVCSYI